jgi:hypothetical protein
MKYLLSLLIISCVGLVACSDKEAKNEGVLTDSQEKALEGAKDVNDTILNADEERRKKLEEATE